MKSLPKAGSAALADSVSTLTRRVQGQLTGRLKVWLKDRYIKRVYCQGKFSHIFLIFKYCRISGNDMTARSPRVAAAAAMVIAEIYPSVRIVCLLFFS
jgi:hypothetical protein